MVVDHVLVLGSPVFLKLPPLPSWASAFQSRLKMLSTISADLRDTIVVFLVMLAKLLLVFKIGILTTVGLCDQTCELHLWVLHCLEKRTYSLTHRHDLCLCLGVF